VSNCRVGVLGRCAVTRRGIVWLVVGDLSGKAAAVTDGLVVLAAWVTFGLLLLALGAVILRHGGDSR